MRTIQIPYDRGMAELHIEDACLKKVVKANMCDDMPVQSEKELVYDALKHPIGSAPLAELAKNKKRIVVVTSDHTRAMPSRITLPILLGELRRGNPKADITILIGTGLHRPTTREEQIKMFGEEIVENEKIVVNDAYSPEQFANLGFLPSGAELHVNRLAVECDLLITEGFIEPHFFAGYSGGRKSILPGICDAQTVNENHCYKAVADPKARAGILTGNPIHEDMVEAAKKANVQFILNVALDEKKKVIAAFAGDLEQAHLEGVRFIEKHAKCPVETADIVITSNGGYPLDQNLYQSPKAVATAECYAGEDGVIIICCGCADGMGGSYFEKIITMGSAQEIDAYLARIPAGESIPEQWCVQVYARVLMKHKVIVVTENLSDEMIKKANMIPAKTPDEALEKARAIKGKDASVIVIPDGVSVVAEEA